MGEDWDDNGVSYGYVFDARRDEASDESNWTNGNGDYGCGI